MQLRLFAIQSLIFNLVPDAELGISYKMLAFKQQKNFIYVGAFKQHIGIYPPVKEAHIAPSVRHYAGQNGNLKFVHNQPLPIELLSAVIVGLAEQYRAAASG